MMNRHESLQERGETVKVTNQKNLLGQVKLGARVPGGIKGFRELYDGKKIDWEAEYNKVKKLQPEDIPDFADELHTVVCEKLNLNDPEKLHYYTAIGSTIDFGLGTDAFMEIDVGDDMVRVTLDGTFNLFKESHGKDGKPEADVIFVFPTETEEENPFGWKHAIDNAAEFIAKAFKDKAGGEIYNL